MITRRTALAALAATAIASRVRAQDRVAAWREDLDEARKFLALERSFSDTARVAFLADLDSLKSSCAELPDAAIEARLAAAVARGGNAHSRLYVVRARNPWRRLPVRLWRFEQGWFVVAATQPHEDLLGKRVTMIAGHAIEDAEARVATLFAGNAGWRAYMGCYTLTSPDALSGVGLAASDEIEFTFEDATRRTMAPLPRGDASVVSEAWWDLMPAHPGLDAAWRKPVLSPPTLAHPAKFYWSTRIDDVAFVQINRASDAPGETKLAAFGASLLADLGARRPRALVVDLRFNTGGNLDLGKPFLDQLAQLPIAHQRGRFFVITGRATFSAGLYHAAQMVAAANPVLVGETPGDALEFWAEGGNLELPRSKLLLHYADRFHSYSGAPIPPAAAPYLFTVLKAKPLRPDLPAPWRVEDWRAGRDASWEAIRAAL
jgi:hypothetical protein